MFGCRDLSKIFSKNVNCLTINAHFTPIDFLFASEKTCENAPIVEIDFVMFSVVIIKLRLDELISSQVNHVHLNIS